MLRAGSSVAANYEEAIGAFSKEDFIYKVSVALKQGKETHSWVRLLRDSGIATGNEIQRLIQESKEIRNVLRESVVTAKKKKTK